MKSLAVYLFTGFLLTGVVSAQNPLPIPPTLSGSEINLTLQEGTTEFFPGVVTNTMGVNGPLLGPTLILERDSFVSLIVDNQLSDTTTIHWHGMHVAPENDGGPHSIILPNTIWNPQFTVMDKAGINWYHPHLHMRTDEHVTKGIAGLIIVRDSEEAALNLPRTYGVDDFPIVLQTKGFDGNGQVLIHTEMDTTVLTNGVTNAEVDFPAQVVRLRILNGSTQRVMEIGFSDNRNFELIGTDGGLLTAPVQLNRYRMAPGQRADILLDLSSDQGQNIQLMSFASELPNAVYGSSQPGMGPGLTNTLPGYSNNDLNGTDYSFLNITVVSSTNNPVTSIPSTLATYTPLDENDADITRNLTFNMQTPMSLAGPFTINGTLFDMETINYNIPLGNTEIWSITNQTPIAHPFHIHDVQFFILDINGNPPPPELEGLNDVVLVPGGMGTVRFIAEFNDFANDTVPYMYHCHMLTHEDAGMMGQFLVTDVAQSIGEIEAKDNFSIVPNPATGKFQLMFDNTNHSKKEIVITDAIGKTIHRLSSFDSISEINAEGWPRGIYFVSVRDESGSLQSEKVIIY